MRSVFILCVALLATAQATDTNAQRKLLATKASRVRDAVEFPLINPLNNGFKTITKSLGDCEKLCLKSKGCFSYTRYKATVGFFPKGACFLYGGIGLQQANSAAESGVLKPRVKKPKLCKFTEGVSFLGKSISGNNLLYTESAEECCLRCQENKKCRLYTYLEEEGTCWLKGSFSVQIPCDDCVSGFPSGKTLGADDVEAVEQPDPPNGGEWDVLQSAFVTTSLVDTWNAIKDPKDAMILSHRQLVFNLETKKSTLSLELPTGAELDFKVVKVNNDDYYIIFELLRNSKGIFVADGVDISIVGSFLMFQVNPGEAGEGARIDVAWQAKVNPEELKPTLNSAFEGFMLTLVDNFKLEFGSGRCGVRATTREILGTCNNPENPSFGAAGIPLTRLVKNDPSFSDKKSEPSGNPQISPRVVSNEIGDEGTDKDDGTNRLRLTDAHVYFGQFIDHDTDLSPIGAFTSGKQPFFSLGTDKFNEPLPIPVPSNDKFFTGKFSAKVIPFLRSVWIRENNRDVNPRTHINRLTAYLDLGMVYGAENVHARSLRSFKKGLLKTSKDGFLPVNGLGENGIGISLENAPNAGDDFYVAGDIRCNEVAGLVAMHALWLKEHNLIAEELDKAFKGKLDDELLYEYAREINIAQYQSMVYNEYLPLLLGKGTLDPNDWEYDPAIDASIDAFFSTVSFRFGHSMVGNWIWKVGAGVKTPVTKPTESFMLREVFFKKAGEVIDNDNLPDWLRGMAWHEAREMDTKMVSEMRNFLFTDDPKKPAKDLLAFNLQRARDFGLPMYNDAREAFGLKRVKKFSEITCDANLAKRLQKVYKGKVNDVDPFIGGLAECAAKKEYLVGPLFFASLKDTFGRIRDGDRLFYKGVQFPENLVKNYPRINDIRADKVKLIDIVVRNTAATYEELGGKGRNIMTLA